MLRHASRAYACRLWRTLDLRLSCFPDGHCSALPDCSAIGCKRNAVSTSGRNNQTIGWVPVERRGKTGKCDHNVNIEWYDFDHCGASRISYPDVERAIQHKAALCVQHLCFPKAHRRQAQSGPRRQPIQCGSFPLLEPTGPSNHQSHTCVSNRTFTETPRTPAPLSSIPVDPPSVLQTRGGSPRLWEFPCRASEGAQAGPRPYRVA